MLSTRNASEEPAADWLPAGSVCRAVTVHVPSTSVGSTQLEAVAVQVTVVWPGDVAVTTMVAPDSHVTTSIVGVRVAVTLSVVLEPESEAALRSGTIAAGAVTSSAIESSAVPGAVSTLPARSVVRVYT